MPELEINGERRRVDVPSDMPLLWVLRDVILLHGDDDRIVPIDAAALLAATAPAASYLPVLRAVAPDPAPTPTEE